MILEGNERGYGAELARHLLNPRDNDHVTVHAVEGFATEDLFGAFAEAEAISGATRCKNYLFSLSLNPPPQASVSVEAFEAAIASVEERLGLTGQPRAIVFHEKNGRRHAHCVWSRIDAAHMRAVNIAHYKHKLTDISRELYRAHDWDMPEGFRDRSKRDPLTFNRAKAGQAKRAKRDPKAMKAMFRQCWERSDGRESFAAALKAQGFVLARGDRRGFVAVDGDGKIWSLSRWCGVRPKDMRARLGPEESLPSLSDVQADRQTLPRPRTVASDPDFETQRGALVARQRKERAQLLEAQKVRRIAEDRRRQASLPRGLKGAFLRVTGQFQTHLRRVEAEAEAARQRDRDAQQRLIERHLKERRALDQDRRTRGPAGAFRSAVARDPQQVFVAPEDDLALSRAQLQRDPSLILAEISRTKARFGRVDVLRGLARKIDDPMALQKAADQAMGSPDLIRIEGGKTPLFTTRDFQQTEAALAKTTRHMASNKGFGVARDHIDAAIRVQDRHMNRTFGGKLSGEQRAALHHVLDGGQISAVVGFAGAGKSTMLATAQEAWRRQGVRVHGAALAGKAADGLENASGIQSRTLASLELSWENGNAPIQHGDVLVVDEAGMVGTRQMARIASKMQEIGAKLVLVGDPDQLQPIEAGRPFRDMVDTHAAARLTEIHRQRDDWQKRASHDLATGAMDRAVEAYAARGAVWRETSRDAALEALVETYAMDVAANGDGATRLAFAHRRKDVHTLNQAIRGALRQVDHPAPEVLLATDTGKRAFAAGDRIVFGRNDRDLGVRNGMLGTVTKAGDGTMSVVLDGNDQRHIQFDPRQYRAFDHGYAVTIHKSQGATVDQAYVLASRSMDRHLAYVAMTRHRAELRLYLNDQDRPQWSRAEGERARHNPPRRSGPSLG